MCFFWSSPLTLLSSDAGHKNYDQNGERWGVYSLSEGPDRAAVRLQRPGRADAHNLYRQRHIIETPPDADILFVYANVWVYVLPRPPQSHSFLSISVCLLPDHFAGLDSVIQAIRSQFMEFGPDMFPNSKKKTHCVNNWFQKCKRASSALFRGGTSEPLPQETDSNSYKVNCGGHFRPYSHWSHSGIWHENHLWSTWWPEWTWPSSFAAYMRLHQHGFHCLCIFVCSKTEIERQCQHLTARGRFHSADALMHVYGPKEITITGLKVKNKHGKEAPSLVYFCYELILQGTKWHVCVWRMKSEVIVHKPKGTSETRLSKNNTHCIYVYVMEMFCKYTHMHR